MQIFQGYQLSTGSTLELHIPGVVSQELHTALPVDSGLHVLVENWWYRSFLALVEISLMCADHAAEV